MAQYIIRLLNRIFKSPVVERNIEEKQHNISVSNSVQTSVETDQKKIVPDYIIKHHMNINSTFWESAPVLITPVAEAKRFMKDCLEAVGTPCYNAKIVAENLVTADHRGVYSHGMNRLERYIRDIQKCRTDVHACPQILKETPAVALIDGRNGLGAVIGKKGMDLAIKKAKKIGIGFVTARGCTHYGIAGMYTLQAIEKGFIGISVSNTTPLMVPTRAKMAALGTNPFSVGAPGLCGDSFVLDMATTAVALGKLEVHRRKGEKIPNLWALNDEGQPETDPDVAHKAAKLLPLGGTEANSGYKGYGFAMVVEVLSGLLAGAAFGPHIGKWGASSDGKPPNLGTSFMAIDPKAFETQFGERLQDLMCHLRTMEPVDPKTPVLVQGDPEREHMKKVEKDGGLRYVPNQHETMKKLAEEFKVDLPCSMPLKEC